MGPILTHGLTTFTARFTGFLRAKLVGGTGKMGRPSTFACDLALFSRIH
jgi:hypothetical protein